MNEFYIVSEYYRRDTQFAYEYDLNEIDQYEFSKGIKIEKITHKELLYVVDKIDSYILDYDFLPVMGPPLVSSKLRDLLLKVTKESCQFLPAVISDGENILRDKFFILNILKVIECIDPNKSMPPIDKSLDGLQNITTMYFDYKKLKNIDICRVQENLFTIICSHNLVELCFKKNINGITFMKEGSRKRPVFIDKKSFT